MNSSTDVGTLRRSTVDQRRVQINDTGPDGAVDCITKQKNSTWPNDDQAPLITNKNSQNQ